MFHKFDSIPELLQNHENFQHVRNAAMEYDALKKFFEIFPELKNVVQPVRISKGVLFLRVDNSIMRNEIQIKKTEFINKINKTLNTEIIRTIKFVI